jgi:hypothetical protein
MATQKYWNLKYVAGNPVIFTRVCADASGPGRRSEVLWAAEKIAANGWRACVEHAVSGERIFESEAENAYKQATGTAA